MALNQLNLGELHAKISKFKKTGGVSENSRNMHQECRILKIDQEMTEKIELEVGNPKNIKLKMGQFEPLLKIFSFLRVRFIIFFVCEADL